MDKTKNIFPSGFLSAYLVGLATASVMVPFILAPTVFFLVFAGILAALAFDGLALLIRRYLPSVKRQYAVALSVASAFLFSGILVWALAPQIGEQIRQLEKEFPRIIEQNAKALGGVPFLKQSLNEVQEHLEENSARDLVRGVFGIFASFLGAIGSFLFIAALGIYLALQAPIYQRGLLSLFPSATTRNKIYHLMQMTAKTLQSWLLGRAASMALIGVSTSVALSILGVSFPLTLGALAAVLTWIPNFGPVISAIPALLLALAQSTQLALWVLLFYLVLQTVESYLITPLIQQHATSVPPALILFAQVLLGTLFGILALALATPLVAAVLVIVREGWLPQRGHPDTK